MPIFISPKKFVKNRIWGTRDDSAFCRAFNLYTAKNKSWKITVSFDDGFYRVTDTEGYEIAVLHRDRLPLYKRGIRHRAKSLLRDYMIDPSMIEAGDVVIDCGANIGEIGVGLMLEGITARYIAFEPGLEEFRACQTNNPASECLNLGLWNEDGTLTFYNKSDTADSSLIEISDYDSVTTVTTTALDRFCADHGIDTIKVLKLEAEGAEPEILQGAERMIARTRFIAVDCGFERGVAQTSTLPQVANYLIKRDFELKSLRKDRLTALFENTALSR
ncbi:MAG: FkbM family methyltransferase [Roseibium sp.]|nr:FkbM family methyltransferase [Roseibium sp.]